MSIHIKEPSTPLKLERCNDQPLIALQTKQAEEIRDLRQTASTDDRLRSDPGASFRHRDIGGKRLRDRLLGERHLRRALPISRHGGQHHGFLQSHTRGQKIWGEFH